ncbi:hypothetical protein ACOSP7_005400 [Xanthoceras sorbifolium]
MLELSIEALLFFLFLFFAAFSVWNANPELSNIRNKEIEVLALIKFGGGNILSAIRLRKTGLGDSSTIPEKAIGQASLRLTRKFGELDDNEDWMEETMRVIAFPSGHVKPRSSHFKIVPFGIKSMEASPSSKGFTSIAKTRQTRSSKGKASALSKDNLIDLVGALVEFDAKTIALDSAAKVMASSPNRALDKVASFACLKDLDLKEKEIAALKVRCSHIETLVGSASSKGYKLAQLEVFINHPEIALDFMSFPSNKDEAERILKKKRIVPLAGIKKTQVEDDTSSSFNKSQEEDDAAIAASLDQKGVEGIDHSIDP